MYTATYSPEDNKLRLYSVARLDKETYDRVKAAGFRWAPAQKLFVAPAWTPGREDLLIDLCGEIGDEDTSLVKRAEERADRFETYSEKRADDAESARAAVAAIADNIPLGQPILVGHHSEKRARRDAERIENGMRKAVKMWETSQYWTERAAAARCHAEYKQRPDVRARRIKTIEADLRKVQRATTEANAMLRLWKNVENNAPVWLTNKETGQAATPAECALFISNRDHVSACFPLALYPRLRDDATQYEGMMSLWSALDGGVIDWHKAQEIAVRVHERENARRARWISHYENRLAYERAMLAEDGGTAADKFNIEVGGRVLVRGSEWLVVLRVNRSAGVIASVTTNAPAGVHWSKTWKYGVEEINDYRAPEKDDAEKVKKATALAPLCNYPGEGFRHMTKAEYMGKSKDYRMTRDIEANDKHGRHRLRRGMFENCTLAYVYLTDVKRVDPPAPNAQEPVNFERKRAAVTAKPAPAQPPSEPDTFSAMREQLKQGVKIVVAPQLFPTPAALAARMVELADIEPGNRVLEPSAGTGNIVRELIKNPESTITAIEIDKALADTLRHTFLRQPGLSVRSADFLQCNGEIGEFDRIVMNPPFAAGQDVEHILHAFGHLKPGGRLVAICANGPHQNEALKPWVELHGGDWEPLPADAFKESGTMVRAVLISVAKN